MVALIFLTETPFYLLEQKCGIKMKNSIIELARELIRRPSISPDDQGCQQIIAERLERLGFQIEWLPLMIR